MFGRGLSRAGVDVDPLTVQFGPRELGTYTAGADR